MTNVLAIHSVGNSLITYLRNAYPGTLTNAPSATFSLRSSGDFGDIGDDATIVSLYLYRIRVNEHLRNTARPLGSQHPDVPLAVDLHYLVTAWSSSALIEHLLMAWVMRELHLHPLLDRSYLSPEADWDPEDAIQIVPTELSNEELMRIWDALQPHYRLSVSYVVRAVRIDPDTATVAAPVVATRFGFSDGETQP